jgi:hypothetical protein
VSSAFRRQLDAFRIVSLLEQVTYFWFARATLAFFPHFDSYSKIPDSALPWPVFWHSALSRPALLNVIGAGSALAYLFVLVKPGLRLARVLVAYAFLCQLGMAYAWGDVGHADHAYFWTLVVLALAPCWKPGESRRKVRQRVLQNYFFCQVLLAFFYFLSGVAKMLVAFQQLFAGTYSTFHLTGMSRILAARLLLGNTDTLLGDFLVAHPTLAFLGFWSTVAAELSGLWLAFRPRYHRAWGFVMAAFHLMMALSLSPNFSSNLFLVTVLFVLSPFAGDQRWCERACRLIPKFRNGLNTKI